MAQGFNVRIDTIMPGYSQVAFAVAESDPGEYIVSCGSEWLDSLFYSSVVNLTRVDADGEVLSTDRIVAPLMATYPGTGGSLIQLPNGGYVVGGGTFATGWIQKPALYWFDADGQALGFVQIDTLVDFIGRQVHHAHDGGFMMVGDAWINNDAQGFLLKTDSSGELQWWRTYGQAQWRNYIYTVDLAPNGGYYLGGKKETGNFSYDPWVMRCDSLGNVEWEITNGTTFNDAYHAALITLADGNLVYGSGKATGLLQDQRPQLVKMDSLGAMIWDKLYDTASAQANFLAVKEVSPGGDLIACGVSAPGLAQVDGVLCRTTSEGDSIWLRHYWAVDDSIDDYMGYLWDVSPTSDGGFVACGTAHQSASGNNPPGMSQDVWVIKVDSMGCVEPGCNVISGMESQVTNLHSALMVFPNPVAYGGQATVEVQLPEALRTGSLRLVLVNAQGQLVGEQPALQGANVMELSGLSAGLYHLHLVDEKTWLAGTKLNIAP